MSSFPRTDRIRRPAVAGTFYPGDPTALTEEVRRLLDGVSGEAPPDPPKAIVVPHAGYSYSGAVAAAAFQRLIPGHGKIRTIVALGPSHRHRFRGLALPACTAYAAPNAILPLPLQAARRLLDLSQVVQEDMAHRHEHCLEVELPFLVEVLGDVEILPLVVGEAFVAEVKEVLDLVWGGEETLILISSDLSHYLSHEEASRVDRRTADAVLALEGSLETAQACGAIPLDALIECAREKGLKPELLALRTSGDSGGDRARVVGYGAFAFYQS